MAQTFASKTAKAADGSLEVRSLLELYHIEPEDLERVSCTA